MVSFFGLKLGAAKKKKEASDAMEHSIHHQQWKQRIDQNTLSDSQMLEVHTQQHLGIGSGSSIDLRPGTANSIRSVRNPLYDVPESHKMAANSMYGLANDGFKGFGSAARVGSSMSVSGGTGPSPSPVSGLSSRLKPYASEANLRPTSELLEDLSSARQLRFGGGDGGSRPGSSHSLRSHNGANKQWVNPLDVHFGRDQPHAQPQREMTPMSPIKMTAPKSPLGEYELRSPVKSDTASLLGDEPEKIAQEISAKINQAEEDAKTKAATDEQAKVQAELESRARRNAEANKPALAYPSPPKSIRGDGPRPWGAAPTSLAFGPSPRLQGSGAHELRPNSRGQDNSVAVSLPRRNPSDDMRSGSTGRVHRDDAAAHPTPQPQYQAPLADEMSADSMTRSQSHEAVASALHGPAGSQGHRGLEPREIREPMRGATVPGPKPAGSPMLHGSDRFEPKSDNLDIDKEESIVDPRTLDAPYGIPSPPLSNGQRFSIDETNAQPVSLNTETKQDTSLVGSSNRETLDLQIEEFEKSLQRAQFQQVQDHIQPLNAAVCSRRNSASSSHYSDSSASPTTTIERPVMSPKFPLAPRPRSPAVRPRPSAPIRRPTLEEYGVKLTNAHPETSGRIRRPSPDEYGITHVRRTESPAPMTGRRGPSIDRIPEMGGRSRTASPATYDSPYTPPPARKASPPVSIRTDWDLDRPPVKPQGSLGTSAPQQNSPANSHNPFSPPPSTQPDWDIGPSPAKAASPVRKVSPAISVKPDWDLGHMPAAAKIQGSSGTSRSLQSSPVNNNSSFSPPSTVKQDGVQGPVQPAAARKRSPSSSVQQQAAWDLGPAPTPAPTAPLPIPERVNRRDMAAKVASIVRKIEEPRETEPRLSGYLRQVEGPKISTLLRQVEEPRTATMLRNLEEPRSATLLRQVEEPKSATFVRQVEEPKSATMLRQFEEPALGAPLPTMTTTTKPRPVSLAPSASIVPDTESNPNWPLPAPSPTFSTTVTSQGASPRRQSRRAPPAPINIAATRYADDISFGGDGEPYNGGNSSMVPSPMSFRPKTAGTAYSDGDIWVDTEFEWKETRTVQIPGHEMDREDLRNAIGMARGPSIRYDKVWQREQKRERERKASLARGMGAMGGIEETAIGMPSSPRSVTAGGEPFDRTRRPNQGLRSPTGIADEHGTGFI